MKREKEPWAGLSLRGRFPVFRFLFPTAAKRRLKRWGVLTLLGFAIAIASPSLLWAQTEVNPYQQTSQLERQAAQQRENGQFAAAADLYRQIIERYRELGETDEADEAFFELAKTVLLMKDYPQAIALFEQMIAQHGGGAQTLTNLSLALFETGQYAKAETALKRAIAIWESLRSDSDHDDIDKVTLFEQQAHTYRLLQKVLIAQNKTEAALETAEGSRARSLVEQLARANGATAPNLPTLSDIQRIAQQQNSTLVEYSLVGSEARILGIEPQDETHLYSWVIQPSGKVAFRQIELKTMGINSIREVVEQAREKGIGVEGRGRRGSRANTQNPLEQLHQLLIEPIADLLPTDPKARVTFVPQGALFLVPFAALQDATGQFLIEQHTLLTTPAIQLLSLTQGTPFTTGGKLAIVGNPTMPSLPGAAGLEQLSSLPGAEEEADAIAALFNTRFLTGDEATQTNVVEAMRNADIIHFATHGLLDFDADLNAFGEVLDPTLPTAREGGVYFSPGAIIVGGNVTINGVPAHIALSREKVARVAMPGLLALAPTPEDDGFLSAQEIVQLDLQAQLVVLSACDTGRGRITGDGVVGLARSFIAAGVESVVVSLWAVPDTPTAELMVEFYRNLQRLPDRAQALRQAMLTTKQKYPEPINWAAFVLVGEA
jgi:CHAT domain-containing protein